MLALAFGVLTVVALTFAARTGETVVPGPGGADTTASLRVERTIALDAPGGQPTGIAVSGDRLYIADPGRHVVDVLTREGSRVATIGAGSLRAPVYVAVGPVDGRVYVSDRVRETVVVYGSTGTLFGVLTPGGIRARAPIGPAWRPLALGFSPDGTLYVADSAGDQVIAVFSPAGSRIGTIGADVPVGRSGRRLAFPNGIAASRDRIVVADSNNGRLVVFDRSGRYLAAIPVEGLPRGVALLEDGRIVVTDAARNEVSLLTSAGAPVSRLAGAGRDTGFAGTGRDSGFVSLAGVSVGGDGRVYVAESGSGSIRVVLTDPGAANQAGAARRGSPWTVVAIVCGLLALGAVVAATARGRAGTRGRARRL
jgi:DNA-binding beta-propeller fold protein YncE